MLSVEKIQEDLGLDNDIRVESAINKIKPTHGLHKAVIQALWDRFGDTKFGRQDFRPSIIPPKVLPNTCLLDAEKDGDQILYRYRVFGTEMRDVVGRDLAHQTVRDYPKRSCRTYLTRLHDECYHQRRPVYSKAEIEYPRDIVMETDKLFVPFFDAVGEDVEMILTVFIFSFRRHHSHEDVDPDIEPLSAHERFRAFDNLRQLQSVTNQKLEIAV